MKEPKFSFLFFLFFYWTFQVNGQQSDNSLSYYYELANNPKSIDNSTDAYAFYSTIKDENLRLKDMPSVINNLRQIAIIEFDLGLLQESEQTVVEALTLLDANELSRSFEATSRIGLNNYLGRVSRHLRDFQSALKYYQAVLDISKNTGERNTALNNLGLVYRDKQAFNEALLVFEEVHKNNLQGNDTIKIAHSYTNLGNVQAKLGYKEEGLANLNKSLELRKALDFKKGVFASYFSISNYYKDINDIGIAKFYANKAIEVANETKSPKLKYNGLSLLVSLNDDENIRAYKRFNDSISLDKLNIKNAYSSKKYSHGKQKKIAQNKALEAQKYRQESIICLLAGFSITLLSIGFFLYLKYKYKKNSIVQIYKTETRISKKVHDEVANDIYFVMNKLQNKKILGKEVLDDLEKIYLKTRDISRAHGVINMNDNFAETLKFLLLNYKTNHVAVITKGIDKIVWESLSDNQKTALYRVLQELMTNMKKHSRATLVAVTFEQTNKKTTITYKDNGAGTSIKKANGLLNAENRIKTVNGCINFESEIGKGFKSIITM